MIPKIVIGANFGDEGKGLATSHFALNSPNKSKTLVTRFNGGSQAGHTVECFGMRHVFQHFGSGTLFDVPTYLSEDFVVYPLHFLREYNELRCRFYIFAKTFINANAPLTTPYDVMLNWALERARGSGKHGSCGMGIGETIQRCTDPNFITTVADILQPDVLRCKLQNIRSNYFVNRLEQLNASQYIELELEDDIIDQYIEICNQMLTVTTIVHTNAFIHDQGFDSLIFEGAQGLLLDQDHRYFPHVTRSKTGIHNATKILKSIGITQAEVYYMTRSYVTRHGAGPLPYECDGKIYPNIIDDTNFTNQFQGHLRFAPLCIQTFAEETLHDLQNNNVVHIEAKAVITCVNQVPDNKWKVVDNGEIVTRTTQQVLSQFGAIDHITDVYVSRNPHSNVAWSHE